MWCQAYFFLEELIVEGTVFEKSGPRNVIQLYQRILQHSHAHTIPSPKVDIHQEDRLGRLSVSAKGLSQRNALVFDFAHRMESPLVICMGGGYPRGKDWTPIIEAHTAVYWEAHQYLAHKYTESRRIT